ncbi:hypothetical protein HPB51_016079 [Rhipicephalus microplus]|uniref:Uncharacterized protein n=1 Tax=Rhipicephalus microplus TaxID=6941 RepID=A0A9J6DI92_RHIMP|nr:hypothetical protein HPB51_016079 [Rhipicephalus microplus]
MCFLFIPPVFLLTSWATVFTKNYLQFTMTRIFTCHGINRPLPGIFRPSNLKEAIEGVAVELVGPSRRLISVLLFQLAFPLGEILLAVAAYMLPDWRHLSMALAAPTILLLPYYWLLPESIAWCLHNKKEAEAIAIINRAARWNNRTPIANLVSVNPCSHSTTQTSSEPSSSSLVDLFRTARLCFRTLNVSLNWLVNAMVYYGLSLSADTLGGTTFHNFGLLSLIEIPGVFLAVLALQYGGRRIMLSAFMLLAGLFCVIVPFIPEGYLKSTGCQATWETFLRESPDLKEYAEYVRRGRDIYITVNCVPFTFALPFSFFFNLLLGGSASTNDLLPNLQNLSAQLNDVLARLQSTQPENNAPASAPTNGNEAHSSSSTNALPQQPYRTDQQSAQPLMLTTSSGYPPLHHSSASPQQERRHPHSGGDTLSYHVHTHIPPLPLLPPSIASVLKHNSPPKQLPGGLARFEPPEKDLGRTDKDGHHEDQCDDEPADEPVHCVEPMSEGFEVSPDAGAETQTEVSEEIDVDGSSRGPSPANEEAAIVGAVSGCAVSASCVIGSSSAPASTMTSAVSSPRTTAASLAQHTPDHPPSAENSTSFETPENTGVPPLPSRFPDPDSPRAILSEARSLLPSLTTPVKAIRFDPERFYSPRRKSLIPRRRLLAGFSPSSKPAADSGNTNSSTEESREFSALLDELVHNYPFVAKLAENINQAVVGPDGTYNEGTAFRLEPIAEETPTDTGDMLTSQESTMPESLIKEILNKTENDPVFEAALAQICGSMVENAFEKCSISNSLYGTEDNALWEAASDKLSSSEDSGASSDE